MTLNAIFHTARADFYERVRSSGLIFMLAMTAYLSYAFVPPLDASYTAVSFGSTRLFYNSAGIGLMFGITISLFVSLFAFYLVKNSIARDRQTRVGQIIGTTPTQKALYLLGKWGSNLLFLSLIVVTMSLMAPVMQLLRGETSQFALFQMLLPIWLVGLPVMSLVAGVAILFESVPFLRGGFGNVVYYFLWTFMLIIFLAGFEENLFVPDLFGVIEPLSEIYEAIGNDERSLTLIGTNELDATEVYRWEGQRWSISYLISRLFWLMMGGVLAVSGSVFFDRFNPANARAKGPGRIEKLWRRWQNRLFGRKTAVYATQKVSKLTPLQGKTSTLRLSALLMAELRLLLNGQPWYLFAGLIGLTIFNLVNPLNDSNVGALYPLVVPILILSILGAREQISHTQQLIFTTPYPHLRQLLLAWLAGVIVTFLFVAGYSLRLIMVGDWLLLSGVLSAVMFVPALAIGLGTLSGTRRLFEITYLVWWYMAINVSDGFLSGVNFVNPQASLGYLLGTIGLLATAVFVRRFQLNR